MNLNEIKYHLNEIDKLTAAMDLGDIFSYSKVKEVLMAAELGHTVPKNYSGADGIMPDGTPVEYKSTIGKKISATYNGISVQDTWEEQEKYIIEEKIGKYPYHYYARFEGTKIVEMYVLDAKDVIDILLPKLKKSYGSTLKRKDPRLGVTISEKIIKQYGRLVLAR